MAVKGESLKLAAENHLSSVSFPSISTGAYGYPLGKASVTAMETVISFLRQSPGSIREVVFVLFDPATFSAYSSALDGILGGMEKQGTKAE